MYLLQAGRLFVIVAFPDLFGLFWFGNGNAQLQCGNQGQGDHLHSNTHGDFVVKVTYKSNRCHFINTSKQLYSITGMGSSAVNGYPRTKINLTYRHSAATTVVNMSEC